MPFKYQTRNASGAVCCAGNTPDFPRCPRCRAAEQGEPMRTATLRTNTPAPAMRTAGDWANHFGRELQGYGSVVTHTPDAYAAVRALAPRQSVPSDDPHYQPFGTPASGYDLALAKQKEAR